MYADDTTLYCKVPRTDSADAKFISTTINLDLKKIQTWLDVNKLSLNADKTKYMIFHRPRSPSLKFELLMNNQSLEQVANFNYLGLIIDDTLSWSSHIKFLSTKISSSIGALRKLNAFPTNILFLLYNSLIVSRMNYMIFLWGAKCVSLLPLQKKAIRVICHSSYLAHCDPLLRKLNTLKIDDLYKLGVLKFYHKLINGCLPEFFKASELLTPVIHEHGIRTKKRFFVPFITSENLKNLTEFKLSSIVNELPENYINQVDTHSFQTVVSNVKQYYINKLPDTTCPGCYACCKL